jgi:hypothetical protein
MLTYFSLIRVFNPKLKVLIWPKTDFGLNILKQYTFDPLARTYQPDLIFCSRENLDVVSRYLTSLKTLVCDVGYYDPLPLKNIFHLLQSASTKLFIGV